MNFDNQSPKKISDVLVIVQQDSGSNKREDESGAKPTSGLQIHQNHLRNKRLTNGPHILEEEDSLDDQAREKIQQQILNEYELPTGERGSAPSWTQNKLQAMKQKALSNNSSASRKVTHRPSKINMSSELLKTATSDYESQIIMKKHLISQRIISKKIGDGQPNAKRTLPCSPTILDQEARNQQRKLNLSQTLLGHQVPETENEKIQTRFCQPQAFKFVICYHSKSHQKRVANFIQEALLVQRKLLQKEAQNGQRSESQLRAINNASQLSNMPPVLWQFLKRFYWTLGGHSDYQDITPQQVYNINQAMISFTPRDFLKFMDLHSTLQMRDGSELFTLFIKEALQGEFNFAGTINAYRDQFNSSAVSSEMGSPERQGRNVRARISTAPVTVSNSMRRQRLA